MKRSYGFDLRRPYKYGRGRAKMGGLDNLSLISLAAIAAGAVTGATGATTALEGPVVVARTGAGVYTLTLTPSAGGALSCAAANCVCMITLRTSGTSNYIHTSATVKTVNTFAVDGTTATDKNFDFVIYDLGTLV
jgi:hypothetical protein